MSKFQQSHVTNLKLVFTILQLFLSHNWWIFTWQVSPRVRCSFSCFSCCNSPVWVDGCLVPLISCYPPGGCAHRDVVTICCVRDGVWLTTTPSPHKHALLLALTAWCHGRRLLLVRTRQAALWLVGRGADPGDVTRYSGTETEPSRPDQSPLSGDGTWQWNLPGKFL